MNNSAKTISFATFQEFPPKKFSAGKVYLAKGFRKHAIRIHAALESHPWLSKVCESLLPDRPCWRDRSVGRELLATF